MKIDGGRIEMNLPSAESHGTNIILLRHRLHENFVLLYVNIAKYGAENTVKK